MRRALAWLLDRPPVFLGLLMALLVLCFVMEGVDVSRRCDGLMALAHTQRDSLDARIACEKIKSDAATAMAVSVGAGLVAGSVIGSSR